MKGSNHNLFCFGSSRSQVRGKAGQKYVIWSCRIGAPFRGVVNLRARTKVLGTKSVGSYY